MKSLSKGCLCCCKENSSNQYDDNFRNLRIVERSIEAHSRLVENCLLENNEFKTLDCDTGCVSDSESSIDDDEDSYQAMMENSRSEHLDDDEINMDCTSGDTGKINIYIYNKHGKPK